MEERAVVEDNLGAAAGCPQNVAVFEQHRRIGPLADALVSEFDSALDVGEVGRSNSGR